MILKTFVKLRSKTQICLCDELNRRLESCSSGFTSVLIPSSVRTTSHLTLLLVERELVHGNTTIRIDFLDR